VKPRAASFAVAIFLAACDGGGSGTHVAIDLDVPAVDRGTLLEEIDSLQFRVSDGRQFLASQVYLLEEGLPDELTLPDVPAGDQVLFDLTGLARGSEVAYGRTCRLVVDEGEGQVRARLYFSPVGLFRPGEDPLEPARRAGLMFSDDRGRAIVTGGSADTIVELFDPRVGEFSPAGQAEARVAGAIAVRDDGTAIVAGGVDPEEGSLVGAVEEVDPTSGGGDLITRLNPARQAEAERSGLALVALPDRSILLTGGRTAAGQISDGVALLAAGFEEFRPAEVEGEEVRMAQARTGHTASVGLGGVAYVIGGLTVDKVAGEAATGSIELYRPQDGRMRLLDVALAVPRFGHSATVLEDGRILVVGGKKPRDPCPEPSVGPELCFEALGDVEVFDPLAGEVRAIEPAVADGIYDHTATILSGGRVLITGGFDRSGRPRGGALLFDPQLEELVPTQSLGEARARHTATELCDGTVLFVGGESAGDEPPASERYNPADLRLP
jgi:hypothetical protein